MPTNSSEARQQNDDSSWLSVVRRWLYKPYIAIGGFIGATGAIVTAVLFLVNFFGSGPPGRQVQIVLGGGTGSTVACSGPSNHYACTNLAAGTSVRLVCTAYGQPQQFPGYTNGLWDYTSEGWVNDHYVGTNVQGPAAPGCVGTISRPVAGSVTPSIANGPYAVVTDEATNVSVRTVPGQSSPAKTSLHSGTLVRLTCSVAAGPVVPAPRALGPGASNNYWDKLVGPVGWIPDSYVATYNTQAVAPGCV
jgi:hypothetical protein